MLAKLDAPVAAACRELQDAQAAAKATPAKIPLAEHNPGMVRLDTETKLITHAIRMAAYNAETILARALNSHYSRAGAEVYALIREALTTSGDIIPADATLTIRLDPLTAPRRTRALARLLRTAQHHPHAFPRHQAHHAIRGQRTPGHYIVFCAMSGAPDTLASVYLARARGDYMPEMIPRRTSRLPTLPGQSRVASGFPLLFHPLILPAAEPTRAGLRRGRASSGRPRWCFSAC